MLGLYLLDKKPQWAGCLGVPSPSARLHTTLHGTCALLLRIYTATLYVLGFFSYVRQQGKNSTLSVPCRLYLDSTILLTLITFT